MYIAKFTVLKNSTQYVLLKVELKNSVSNGGIFASLQEELQRRDNDWFVGFRCGFSKTLPFLQNFPVGKHLCTSCGISNSNLEKF